MSTVTDEAGVKLLDQSEFANEASEEKTRKIAIICSKGSLDMAYPGLILANSARMLGLDAMLFFTFWGMDVITEKRVDNLHVGMVGNPAMHMPTVLAGLPGMETIGTRMMKKKIEDLDIRDVRELLEILDDSGAEIYGCQMAAELMDLSQDDLVPQVKEIITAMDFFEKTEGAQLLFI